MTLFEKRKGIKFGKAARTDYFVDQKNIPPPNQYFKAKSTDR